MSGGCIKAKRKSRSNLLSLLQPCSPIIPILSPSPPPHPHSSQPLCKSPYQSSNQRCLSRLASLPVPPMSIMAVSSLWSVTVIFILFPHYIVCVCVCVCVCVSGCSCQAGQLMLISPPTHLSSPGLVSDVLTSFRSLVLYTDHPWCAGFQCLLGNEL